MCNKNKKIYELRVLSELLGFLTLYSNSECHTPSSELYGFYENSVRILNDFGCFLYLAVVLHCIYSLRFIKYRELS
jgi:hypothetical protein